jgi:hypothetical protein
LNGVGLPLTEPQNDMGGAMDGNSDGACWRQQQELEEYLLWHEEQITTTRERNADSQTSQRTVRGKDSDNSGLLDMDRP